LHRLTSKLAFVGCGVALATLAWLPANVMARTILGGHAEHLIAYLGTAAVLGLAIRTTPLLVAQCILLIGYAALLEVGQLYAIGRHASFQDFAFSSTGVLIGTVLAWIARTCWGRMRPTLARS
jgi:VanZ family protein